MRTQAPAVREPRRRPAGSRASRAKRRRARGDRGAGSAEIVIAVPLLMLLILLVIQFAVWEHAESIAHATAEEALAAARVQGGTAASGQQRAQQVISQIGSSVLVSPQVSVTMNAADLTVGVTGTAERVLPVPGLRFPVTVTVTGPIEQFVPATAQG
jgi:Flp pilus assembly protein TadG